MVSPTVKLTAIALGVGGVTVGAGVGIYNNLSKSDEKKQDNDKQETPKTVTQKSISDLLKNGTKLLLVKGQDTETWNSNWATFKTKYTKSNIANSKWNFDHTWPISDDTAPDLFKDKCLSNSNIEVDNTDDELFKEVELYCTKAKGDG